jgi:hypothetical protein
MELTKNEIFSYLHSQIRHSYPLEMDSPLQFVDRSASIGLVLDN